MAKKATSEFHSGAPTSTTPSQGTGAHSPEVTGARIITGEDRPSVIVDVPTMAHNSNDGVVIKARGHDSQGWYRNKGVKQVET
jgi:hypothetical protein